MTTKIIGLLVAVATCAVASAQLQTADAEGITQAAYLKKLSKKAKYGAQVIQKEISFNTAKGLNGSPVVTAQEVGKVEMVALDNKV